MKIYLFVFSIIISYFPASVIAGSGHDHEHTHSPVSQDVVETNAKNVIDNMVTKNKLEKSWAFAKAIKTEKKNFGGHPEWVVTFENPKVTDVSKSKLYVFLTPSGEYIAANYTGK